MKALRPKGIRIRPSETAAGRIGKPMRLGKCRSKLPNHFKQRETQNFGIQTRPFGRNFKQATEKTAVWHKGNTVFSPAAAVQNFRRNKQKAV